MLTLLEQLRFALYTFRSWTAKEVGGEEGEVVGDHVLIQEGRGDVIEQLYKALAIWYLMLSDSILGVALRNPLSKCAWLPRATSVVYRTAGICQ